MRPILKLGAFILANSVAPPSARAAELRQLCPTRPGLGTAPCIVDQGHMLVEVGLADWTVEDTPDARTDTILAGEMLIRYGLTDVDEVQFGWTAFGHVREREKATGGVIKVQGSGDISLAYKRSLRHPDGNELSIAIQPFVTLPVGGSAIGDGDWSAGLLLPISFDVSDHVQLQVTPEIDASVDEDGHGRHAAFGGVAGLGLAINETIGVTLELSALREQDPAGRSTELLAGVSGTWQPGANWQFDVGAVLGLNHDSPDAELALGVSRRF